jgi:hypothetical protein
MASNLLFLYDLLLEMNRQHIQGNLLAPLASKVALLFVSGPAVE